MEGVETIHGEDGYTIHLEPKDFEDAVILIAGIKATIIQHLCDDKNCEDCNAASAKGLCKAGSCAAAIVDYLRKESKRRGEI